MTQRGSILIYAALGIAAVGVLWGLYSAVDSRGYQRGVAETETAYAARDARQRAEFDRELSQVRAEKDRIEQDHAKRVADIAVQHAKEAENARRKHAAMVDGLRTGAIQLRGVDTRCPAEPGQGGSAQTGSPAGGSNDSAGGVIFGPLDAAFLVDLAAEADAVAGQLTACQAVIRADRGQDGR